MLVTTSTVAGCSWKRSAILSRREPRVLQADLLADDVERQRREAAVHLAHDARQHRAVAHAGVEHAHGRRLGMQVGELHADAARDHLLLAAGVDEQQVLLTVVEEAEVARGRALAASAWPCVACRGCADVTRSSGISSRGRGGRLDAVAGQEGADALQRLRRDAGAVAQARDELAVVDGAPAEGRLGHAGAPAELGDAVQQADRCCAIAALPAGISSVRGAL